MLSISGIGSVGYYSALAERDDYYADDAEAPGRWGGAAAELGLSGQVKPEDFSQVMRGFDPNSGEKLVQNAGAANHRPGWDLTFSAPKSVSLAYAVADTDQRQQIEAAQQRATDAAMHYIEQYAEVRTGAGGTERESARLVHASWQHITSRAQDPQLHTHCTVANVGVTADGKYRTLETKQIYESKMAAGAIYRAELAAQLQQIGLNVEPDGDSFRLSGSNSDLEKIYSTRREEITNALHEKNLSGARASEIAALDTRTKKIAIPRSELFSQWQSEAKQYNFNYNDLQNAQQTEIQTERKTDAQILQSLTDRESTFKPQALTAAIAINENGRLNAEQIQQKTNDLLQSSELIKLQNSKTGEIRLTTREMLELERGMIDNAKQMHNNNSHTVDHKSIDSATQSRTLSDEQKNALHHMTQPHQISAVVGIAGAGKSYTLGAAREAWENSGYKTIGAALSGKAAAGLQESAGIKSDTIHATLKQIDSGELKLDAKTVLIIDEAGMVGSRQTAALIQHVRDSGAKLVLVGDHRQLQPIDAGGAFKAIQGEIGAAEMVENRRQKEQWAAAAAGEIRNGNAGAALAEYNQRGMLHISENSAAASTDLVKNWNTNIKSIDDVKNNLILASTKNEVKTLNELARDTMKQRGMLGASTEINTTNGKLEISEGDRILFNRNNKHLDVKNGTLGHVEKISSNEILVKTDDGKTVNLYGSDYEHISHGYAVTTHKSQGVTVENSFVLNSGSMTSSEMAYVQMSRHKNEAHIFIDRNGYENQMNDKFMDKNNELQDEKNERLIEKIGDRLSREEQKQSTLDYTIENDDKQLNNDNSKSIDDHELSHDRDEPQLELELEMDGPDLEM